MQTLKDNYKHVHKEDNLRLCYVGRKPALRESGWAVVRVTTQVKWTFHLLSAAFSLSSWHLLKHVWYCHE